MKPMTRGRQASKRHMQCIPGPQPGYSPAGDNQFTQRGTFNTALLLGSNAKTMLAKQLYYVKQKCIDYIEKCVDYIENRKKYKLYRNV